MKSRALLLVLALCCAGSLGRNLGYRWDLPHGFTAPAVPANNPMSAAKVELGRHLFYDTRMSGNANQSCASCHIQRLAFTDGRSASMGSTGQLHRRGSMSLVNVAWSLSLTWNNPRGMTLEEQMLVPMFGTQPVELGLERGGERFLKQARQDSRYRTLFRQAFPEDPTPTSLHNVIKAIACFERSIISARSDWDVDWRQVQFESSANLSPTKTSAASRRGEMLFFGDKMRCASCHGGLNFDSTFAADGRLSNRPVMHNNGMTIDTLGVNEHSGKREDGGKFKPPTMRNIALTAPYMHDGRFSTLEQVLDHYAKGGSHAVNQSPLVQGFSMTEQERSDLVEFLRSLSDPDVTEDPRFSDPWKPGPSTHESHFMQEDTWRARRTSKKPAH